MRFFRKKPIVLQAIRWNGSKETLDKLKTISADIYIAQEDYIVIKTLEGNMRADLGDWIIKGIKGEIYPCKPDIFNELYEEV